MIKFGLIADTSTTFVDNSDKITVDEYDAIEIKTGQLFLKEYTELLFKQYGREKREEITNHVMEMCNDMTALGYCSVETKNELNQIIKNICHPSFNTRKFVEKYKDNFLPLVAEKGARTDTVEFFAGTVNKSLMTILTRFEKKLLI